MPNLHITERRFCQTGLGSQQPIEGKRVANQILSIGTLASSGAVNADTQYVSLFAEAACMFTLDGSVPTATVGEYLGAGERMQREVVAGTIVKSISV